MTFRRSVSLLGLLLVVAAAACTAGRGDAQIRSAAATYLSAWQRSDWAAAADATSRPATAKQALRAAAKSLDPVHADFTARHVRRTGSGATVGFAAKWILSGVPRPWRYTGQLSMTDTSGTWRVRWRPADIVPRLHAGGRLAVRRTLPPRASILDSFGRPLFTRQPIVTVGVEPSRVDNLSQLATTLSSVLGVRAADVVTAAQAAKPTDFVPVITLRRSAYESVRAQIHDLPGTVFQTGTRILAPSAHFAQPLLGTIGDATAEVLAEAGHHYVAGDQLGLSGLQRAFNRRLAGTASADIDVVGADGKTVARLAHVQGHPGTPVRTTLDRSVQRAADNALVGVRQPSALVVVRPETGAILAVANSASAPYDIALSGQYPAGSTFKVITATAVLTGGVATARTVVGCPGKVSIDGRVFPNENDFDLGRISLISAFANSCNTTFTELSQRLPDEALTRAAAEYGIGAGWQLPVDSFSGSLPPPRDRAEKAADAIGQGRVLVSPLAEALMAATVVRGSTPAPTLVAGHPAAASLAPHPPPARVLATLRGFMRAVVTGGTATELRAVPGGPVSGKTGTAEHGTHRPLRAHAWFMGFQPGAASAGGDLAFALIVENGQTSGQPALPLVAKFLAGVR